MGVKWRDKKIGNYVCYKATLVRDVSASYSLLKKGASTAYNSLKSQLVTAWYTPQIPVSQGPGEFWGLPGLILEVNSGKTTVLCSEIVLNPKERIEIKKPQKGTKVTRDEYHKIIKKKTKEMRERYRGRSNRVKKR